MTVEEMGFPIGLAANHARLTGYFSFDIGRMKPATDVAEFERAREGWSVSSQARNPHFFSDVPSKPILVFKSPTTVIASVQNNSKSDDNGLEASDFKKLEGAKLDYRLHLSANGIAVITLSMEVHGHLATDDLIKLTNAIVKYECNILCADERRFELSSEIERWRESLSKMVDEKRTDIKRSYSTITIIELPDDFAHGDPEMPIYQAFEHEWHALSVRTIEQWQQRFPKGMKFAEGNQSISPAGVLKINMRNTVIYEYPYSQKEVEELYDPIFVESRIWDLLLAAEMQVLQNLIRDHEVSQATSVSEAYIEKLRQLGLSTLNEIDSFHLSTSKRTRNLYMAIHEAFGIPDLKSVFSKKLEQLDAILNNLRSRTQSRREIEIAKRQQSVLEREFEAARQEGAARILLMFIGVSTGLSLALGLGTAFGWSKTATFWSLIAFLGIYGLLYLVLRLISYERAISCRSSFAISTGVRDVHELIWAVQDRAHFGLEDAVIVDLENAHFTLKSSVSRTPARIRAEIDLGVHGLSGKANGTMEVEVVFTKAPSTEAAARDAARAAANQIASLSRQKITIREEIRIV